MNLDIKRAIYAPLKGNNIKPTLILSGINIVGMFLYFIGSFIVLFFMFIPLAFVNGESSENGYIVPMLLSFCSIVCLVIIAYICVFLFTSYLSGYLLEIIRKKGQYPEMRPIGSKVWEGLKLGFVNLCYGFIIDLPILVLSVIMVISMASIAGIFVSIICCLIIIIYSLVSTTLLVIVTPAIMYVYIKDGFQETFNINKILKLVKYNWEAFLKIFAVQLVAGLILMAIYYTFIGILFLPFLQVYIQLLITDIYSQTFESIDNQPKADMTSK